MALTEDDVIQILKLVEQSTFDELHLENGEIKLVVRKKGCGVAVVESESTVTGSASAPSAHARRQKTPAAQAGRRKEKKTIVQKEGLVPIKAPLLGTVYRRPSPEAPHYVDVGSLVKENDTVCLIEVMKVFTAVKAGVSGRVTEVLVETNEMVEYGQPLFMVEPEVGSA